MSCGWEGNRSSSVELALRLTDSGGLSTCGLKEGKWALCPHTLQWGVAVGYLSLARDRQADKQTIEWICYESQ